MTLPPGAPSTAAGWPCAAPRCPPSRPLTARWDRRRQAELAWRALPLLPLSALATHAFPFERAAEAYACADRKDDGLIHAALRYQGEADA